MRMDRLHFLALFISSAMPFAALAEPAVIQLDQGWSDDQRALYRYTSQGTFLVPSAFLEALEDGQGGRFMKPENLARYGLVSDGANHAGNPYGWPIGFIVDADPNPAGVPQAGLTCAACHSGQIRHSGQRIQIDGGQSHVDFNAFAADLNKQIIATSEDPDRRDRFLQRSVLLGYPKERVERDLELLVQGSRGSIERSEAIAQGSTLTGYGRLDAVNDIANAVFTYGLAEPKNAYPGDAPTSFPYLWDIWRFDWVQYNASARQPMSRNMIEAMGVGRFQLTDPATGEILPEETRWKTTLRVHNLFNLEKTLQKLKPPAWPESVLGPLDPSRYAAGKDLFAANCSGCHGVQKIEGTNEWHVSVIPLDRIGTDPNQAVNFAGRRYDASKLGIDRPLSAAEGLHAVVVPVKRQAYLDAGIAESEWPDYNGFDRKNDFNPSPCGYKARPLTGVWATAPFLHNGSVPTIYDMLSEARPATFLTGGNDIDTNKVGLSPEAPEGATLIDTAQPGNSNAGHWFTDDQSRPGRIGRALSEDERYALIEYLKGVPPDDYPIREVKAPAPAPCSDDPDWAAK